MLTRRMAVRVAAAALLAAVVAGSAVALLANQSSALPPEPGRANPVTTMADPKAGVVDPANYPKQSLWPADPSFTGGPPQKANMGTKPPQATTAP
jgi:hypothetical protein